MINQKSFFHFFVTINKGSNNKKNNFKFDDVSFPELKWRLIITHITNKPIIKLK